MAGFSALTLTHHNQCQKPALSCDATVFVMAGQQLLFYLGALFMAHSPLTNTEHSVLNPNKQVRTTQPGLFASLRLHCSKKKKE